ncbi:hypothetical protein [Xenophilus azovorans]|uniref:hypothetical protein n=1 Tax=Xenophilus azovorans TaxID=151755 RepID=UPI00069241FC|nr:hypothetical protein [Xenophilus azovorans]
MARIRTIKPEFHTSEQVMNLKPVARLAFIGLWNFCDDGGNHPASARTLKAEVFPGDDDLSASDVQALVDQMLTQGLVKLYEVGGKSYWHVTGWHHQRIERPTMKHPLPPDAASNDQQGRCDKPMNRRQPAAEESPRDPGRLDESSANDRRDLDEPSTPEGKGEEGKGEEGKGEEGKGEEGKGEEGKGDSEAKASGAVGAAVPPMSPLEQAALMPQRKEGEPLTEEQEKLLWSGCRHLLAEQGVSADSAGTFIGRLIKDVDGDRALVFDVMREACIEKPLGARAWMRAACKQRHVGATPKKSTASTHAGFDDLNYQHGVQEDGTLAL